MTAAAWIHDSVRRRLALAWTFALLLGAGAFQVAALSQRLLPRPQPLEELSYYPSGRYLEPAALGHAESAADLAWLRAVQYYGEHRHSDNQFLRMDHVFDILTTLAPHFTAAYVFGGFAMGQEGRNFERGEQLMLKGIEANPDDGWLAFQLGFLYFVRPGGRDLPRAAEYFERAGRLPGGPAIAGQFAAFARQNSGRLAVAYLLWSKVQRESPNRYLREIAEREMGRIRLALEAGRRELAMHRVTTPVVLIRRVP